MSFHNIYVSLIGVMVTVTWGILGKVRLSSCKVHREKVWDSVNSLEHTVLRSCSKRYGTISHEVKPNVILGHMSQNITHFTRGAAECDTSDILASLTCFHGSRVKISLTRKSSPLRGASFQLLRRARALWAQRILCRTDEQTDRQTTGLRELDITQGAVK